MHDIDIADRLVRPFFTDDQGKGRTKDSRRDREAGEYGSGDLKTRLDSAVRVSLAVVTEGVTVAPLQGISDVSIKSNVDASQYLSVSFAGPIRSAGAAPKPALTMLIADHARRWPVLTST